MKKKIAFKKIILLVFALVSLFLMMIFIGKGLPFPWQFSTKADNALYVSNPNNGRVILDKTLTRFLILDKNDQIIRSKQIGILDNDYYFGALSSDDYYYIHDVETYDTGEFLKSEKIIVYDKQGNEIGPVASFNYDELNIKICYPHMVLEEYHGMPNIFYIDESSTSISLLKLPEPKTEVLTNPYNAYAKTKILPDDRLYYAIVLDKETDFVYSIDIRNDIYKTKIGTDNCEFVKPNEKNGVFIGVKYEDGDINISETLPCEGQSFRYSKGIVFRSILLWISILYLAFIVVYSIIKAVSSLSKKHHASSESKQILMFILGFIVLLLFFTNEINTNAFSEQKNNLHVFSDMVSNLIYELNPEITVENDKINITNDSLLKAYNTLYKTQCICADNNIDILFSLIVRKNGNYYAVVDSLSNTLLGMNINDQLITGDIYKRAFENGTIFGEVKTIIGPYLFYVETIKELPDGSELCLLTSANTMMLQSDRLSSILLLTIKFFSAIVAVLYILYEIKAWKKGSASRKELLKKGHDCIGLSIVRPLNFLCYIIIASDLAITVLIAKELLANTAYSDTTLLYTLPATLLTIGFFLGSIFATSILRKVEPKKLLIAAAASLMAIMLLSAIFVYSENYVLWTLCFLPKGLFGYCINVYNEYLGAIAPTEESRAEIGTGLAASEISSYALATLSAGYISEMIGTYAVYFLGLLGSIGVLIIILRTKGLSGFTEATPALGHSGLFKEAFSFISKPKLILLILFAFIPTAVMAGYGTYIFPIIMNNDGMSKSDIANILVFIQAIVFYTIPLFKKILIRNNKITLLSIANGIVAVCFVIILINPNSIVSVLILLTTQLFNGLNNISIREYWSNEAKKLNVSGETALTAVLSSRKITETIITPVIGALIGFGMSVFCIVSGCIMTVSAALFPVFSKNKKKES